MSNIRDYKANLIKGVKSLDDKRILEIEKILFKKIINNNNIFVCGNGGAASVANHLLCDFNKGIKISSQNKLKPKIISLSSNIEIITAISNDISYENIFEFQFDNYFQKNDLLLTFSCSGTSKNILKIINYAKSKKIFIISFTGFAPNKIKKLTNLNIDVGIKNYGICEDIFQILMHMLSQNIRKKFIDKKNIKKVIF
jgi:D-sedoheptulose 7-phosphate isomerase